MNQTLQQLGLDNALIQKVESIFVKKIKLNTGDYFVKENEVCNSIGFVVKGACRYFYNVSNGDEITRWVTLENDFITSLSSFIKDIPTSENIQAMKETEILLADKQAWKTLLSENESLKNIWVNHIEEMYLGMENRVYQLIALPADERYRWMCMNQPHFIHQVPDKYLASMLGITPRHLTRLRARKI
jgi:CRP/FNR family transcriptional regulator, anaerobic regulatory protein